MVRYLNPGGFNFGSENLDGYGISNIVVGVAYSIVFYAACVFLWLYRRHPVVKMRNIPLLLLSLLTLHVFAFMVMVVYTLNGAFPCQVEFWCMNLYLPIGIGLFQAQNQQLLIVSRQQAQLTVNNGHYRPLLPKTGRGIGGPKYWLSRLKLWWRSNSEDGKYQGYILVAIIVQVSAQALTAVPDALTCCNIVHCLFCHLQHLAKVQSLRNGVKAQVPRLMSSWMGMVGYAAYTMIVYDSLTSYQGAVGDLAILIQLDLRPVPHLQDSLDSRHLSLAASNHPCYCCWVSRFSISS